MKTCRILDDQYWEKIYNEIKYMFPNWEYPIKKNIKTPVPFVDKIKNWDIVLLDNYFPWEWWEEPLWDIFLKELLERWTQVKIICISDYGKVLLEKYEYWNKANKLWIIAWFITSKDGFEIGGILGE